MAVDPFFSSTCPQHLSIRPRPGGRPPHSRRPGAFGSFTSAPGPTGSGTAGTSSGTCPGSTSGPGLPTPPIPAFCGWPGSTATGTAKTSGPSARCAATAWNSSRSRSSAGRGALDVLARPKPPGEEWWFVITGQHPQKLGAAAERLFASYSGGDPDPLLRLRRGQPDDAGLPFDRSAPLGPDPRRIPPGPRSPGGRCGRAASPSTGAGSPTSSPSPPPSGRTPSRRSSSSAPSSD